MSKTNLYIDCASGISGDMLCKCLMDLCGDRIFVDEQQQRISEELHHQQMHTHLNHNHSGVEAKEHTHNHAYTHRSFQSILTMLSGCGLDEKVKAMTLKIYTVLAIAEAEVHGETLETVHFHEVGRPQAIINMVGIAAALTAINPNQVYASKVMDGTGTVLCAHGEIEVPVPAVRALMSTSNLPFGTSNVPMEMVTPTGLAALLAMEPVYLSFEPGCETIIKTSNAKGDRNDAYNSLQGGLKMSLFQLTE